jgi:D-apiose dehydrogenase
VARCGRATSRAPAAPTTSCARCWSGCERGAHRRRRGYFAAFHLAGWQACGTPAQALCDINPDALEAQARRFGIERRFADVAALLDEVKPTLVDVVLPPHAQQPVVAAVLARGIPVICQKPFGRDLNQARELAALAARQRTPLVVHENFRFTPWFRECRRLIDRGQLGRVHGISFRLRPGDGQGPRAYLDRQPSFQRMPQLLVRETAVHFIDSFRYLMGEVRAVTARLRRLNPVIAGEDAGFIHFEFDDERTGLFDGNRLNEHVAQDLRRTMGEMWLEGEAGVLRLDGDARLWFKPHGAPEAEHAYERGSPDAFGGACTALQAHVLSHLAQGTPLENDAQSYLANLAVQAAAYHSHATGRRVVMDRFDPDTPAA